MPGPKSLPHFRFHLLILAFLHAGLCAADFDGKAPAWSRRSACARLIREPDAIVSEALGIPETQLLGLSRYAAKSRSTLVFLQPTRGSLRLQADPNAVPKPMKIRIGGPGEEGRFETFPFKSARRGPNEGTVVVPSEEAFAEGGAEYLTAQAIWDEKWPVFSANGFTIDGEGIVRDPQGRKFISDYDLVAVIDAEGKRKSFGADGDHRDEVRELLRPLNEAVGTPLFRHDGYYEPKYFDALARTPQPLVILDAYGRGWSRPASDLPEIMEFFQGRRR